MILHFSYPTYGVKNIKLTFSSELVLIEEWVVEVILGLFLSEPLVIPEFRFKRHSSIFIPSILSWSDAEFFILFMKSCKVVEWLEIHMSSKRLRLVMNILDTLGYES